MKKILTLSAILLCVYILSILSRTLYATQITSSFNVNTPQIILDAGHEALENTIKTPKNHRQANVEIIPKTRLNSGFSPFLNCLISRSIINLQIQKINKM